MMEHDPWQRRNTVKQYARHAERFGPEATYATAKPDLSPLELGQLSLRLERLDRQARERLPERERRRRASWKLPQRDARRLALRLLADGQLSTRRIADMATVSPATVRRLRAEQRVAREHWQLPPSDGSPLANLERLDAALVLLDQLEVARADHDEPELVDQADDQTLQPAFQSGEKLTIRPIRQNGSDPAKSCTAAPVRLALEAD